MFIFIFYRNELHICNLTNSVIGIILEAQMVAACLKRYNQLQQILQMSLNANAMSWTHIAMKWHCTHS